MNTTYVQVSKLIIIRNIKHDHADQIHFGKLLNNFRTSQERVKKIPGMEINQRQIGT